MSTAISPSLKARVVGYQILNQSFSQNSSYLPARIALFGEPNTAEEATLDTTPYALTSLKDAGTRYGYGSPIYQMARILLPVSGGGVGAIPVIVYPQEYASGATATSIVLGVTGTATKTVVHSLKINGRDNIDGKYFSFVVNSGDNAAAVIASIVDCVTNVLASPMSATSGTGIVTFASKWKGLTSADCNIEVITNNDAAGMVYAITSTTAGTTTPDIANSLLAFGNQWNTLIVNAYGNVKFAELETANGSIDNKNGKYTPSVFKPFLAISGTTEDDKDDLIAITNASARQDQITNIIATAPLSKGMPYEVAANASLLHAIATNDSPHVGIGGKAYPDMPVPADNIIGDMADLTNRNLLMTKGCSTVILSNGKYVVQDFVTTYAPEGENNPKFQYARDLVLDWNIEYNWRIIVERDIQDKTVIENNVPVRVDGTISIAAVKGLLIGLLKDVQLLAFINDIDFSIQSIKVAKSNTNPARLDVDFKYKRTSTANQVSTDAAVDFSYSV